MNKKGFGGYFPWKMFIIVILICMVFFISLGCYTIPKQIDFNKKCESFCLNKKMDYQVTFSSIPFKMDEKCSCVEEVNSIELEKYSHSSEKEEK